MKDFLKDLLFFLFLLILPYAIIVGPGLYNYYTPTHYTNTNYPYKTEEERAEEKSKATQQNNDTHSKCYYCKETFHKKDLYDVGGVPTCEACGKKLGVTPSKPYYSWFFE